MGQNTEQAMLLEPLVVITVWRGMVVGVKSNVSTHYAIVDRDRVDSEAPGYVVVDGVPAMVSLGFAKEDIEPVYENYLAIMNAGLLP